MGSHYKMENGVLMFAPMSADGTMPTDDEWGEVDEDLVGSEPVVYHGEEMTLSEAYTIIRQEIETL